MLHEEAAGEDCFQHSGVHAQPGSQSAGHALKAGSAALHAAVYTIHALLRPHPWLCCSGLQCPPQAQPLQEAKQLLGDAAGAALTLRCDVRPSCSPSD